MLVLGHVNVNPRALIRKLKPIVDYAANQLGDVGISRGHVAMFRTHQEMIEQLRQGKVDWVTETAFGATLFIDEASAEPFLLRHKRGAGEYHSVVFTRDDSGIMSMDDLADRNIVFEDAGSTSAYLVPKAAIVERGYELVELARHLDPVPAGAVGFFFSGAEENTSTWVFRGLADVGAVSDQDWLDPEKVPQQQVDQFRILLRTDSYPRNLELLRKDLDVRIKQRLEEVLRASIQDPEAAAALNSYMETTGFSAIEPGHFEALDRVRAFRSVTGD